MSDAKKKMIVPATVLDLTPGAAEALTSGLDEANRYLLVKELVGLALAAPLSLRRAQALGAVFGALGRARLKLHAWQMLTADVTSAAPQLTAVHPHVAPVITDIFGVAFGQAGIGTVPTLGSTPEDQADIEAMRDGTSEGWARTYAAMAEEARAAGTLVVEGSV